MSAFELIDTHCHLDFDAYEKDRDRVIDRAREVGVSCMVVPGVDLHSSRAALRLAEAQSDVKAAIGLHPNNIGDQPHHAAGFNREFISALRDLAGRGEPVAIGEIGLDYYRDNTAPVVQQRAFDDLLALASELELPVIVHNREATGDMLAALTNWSAALPDSVKGRAGVLHSFSADVEAAMQFIALGFYVGITGPVTFGKGSKKKPNLMREVAKEVPLDRILIETDSPFLTPHPYRGRRNEPARVRYVAEEIATLRGVGSEEVAAQTTANAKRLFGLG